MKKRILTFLMALCLAITLIACMDDGDDSSLEKESNKTEQSQPSSEQISSEAEYNSSPNEIEFPDVPLP